MQSIYRTLVEIRRNFFKRRILHKYKNTSDPEIKEIVEVIRKENVLNIFNYEFWNSYKDMEVDVRFDDKAEMFYVVEDNRPLYFKKGMDQQAVVEYYRGICAEQDEKSPHKYVTGEFCVEKGDSILDLGAAEGNFVFSNLDKISKAVLVECDEGWIEALKMTFQDCEKIVIVNKMISDSLNENQTSIDELSKKEGPFNFIKMDIEGMELTALRGAENALKNTEKLSVCTYHRQNDFSDISELLEKNGYQVANSYGYMTMHHSWGFGNPYIRRGLIRAKKVGNERDL